MERGTLVRVVIEPDDPDFALEQVFIGLEGQVQGEQANSLGEMRTKVLTLNTNLDDMTQRLDSGNRAVARQIAETINIDPEGYAFELLVEERHLVPIE